MKRFSLIFILFLIVLSTVSTIYMLSYKREIKHLNSKIESLNKEVKNYKALSTSAKTSKNSYTTEHTMGASITAEVQKCMERVQYSTDGMKKCVYSSEEQWNREIVSNTEKLKRALSAEQTELLNKSQKEWEEYKKAEWELNEATIGKMDGTMYINILAGLQVGITEQRARNLEQLSYYFSKQ